MNRVYSEKENNLSNIVDAFWMMGFNLDAGLRGTFWYNLRQKGVERLIQISSHRIFERWEELSPEEVIKYASI